MRDTALTDQHYTWIKNELARDVEEALIIDLLPSVVEKRVICLEKGEIQTLDSMQIASALESQSDLFLSAYIGQ